MMPEPVIGEELRKMKSEYEPLLPIEKKLIWYTFSAGVVLCALLVFLSWLFR
jgi:uncharacterized membrane protein YwaF